METSSLWPTAANSLRYFTSAVRFYFNRVFYIGILFWSWFFPQLESERLQTSSPRLERLSAADRSMAESTRLGKRGPVEHLLIAKEDPLLLWTKENQSIGSQEQGWLLLYFLVQVNNQKQFVVVCGNVNYGSITNFLGDFYHPAREDVNCEVHYYYNSLCGLIFPPRWSSWTRTSLILSLKDSWKEKRFVWNIFRLR